MKLKHLESALSSVPTPMFPSPKIHLEQYPTSAHLTASVIITALRNQDVGDCLTALDLGCGTGMLGMGCALVGCDHVIAIDCDEEALGIAKANVQEMELEEQVNFVLAKVKVGSKPRTNNVEGYTRENARRGGGKGRHRGGRGRSGGRLASTNNRVAVTPITDGQDGIPLRDKCVDTVVTNPPFGTKHNEGMDVQFLYTATRLARRAVYSFHKSSTREYLTRKIRNEWNMNMDVVAQMRFDIRNMYKFHKKKSVDVEVDLIRVYWPAPATQITSISHPEVESEGSENDVD